MASACLRLSEHESYNFEIMKPRENDFLRSKSSAFSKGERRRFIVSLRFVAHSVGAPDIKKGTTQIVVLSNRREGTYRYPVLLDIYSLEVFDCDFHG